MNEKEINEYIEKMKKYKEKVKAEKELSLELLVKAGIYDPKGQLEPVYR